MSAALYIPAAMGLSAGLAVGVMAHVRASRSARVLPSLPSYAEALEGQDDEATRFLAATHDMVMAVTEAWNAARSRTVRAEPLERLLNRDHFLARCKAVRSDGEALVERLSSVASLASQAHSVGNEAAALWTYTRKDHYTTQMVPVVTTDSKGRTRTTMRSRQVYSNSTHTYTFHPQRVRAVTRAAEILRQSVSEGRHLNPKLAAARVEIEQLSPDQQALAERLVRHTIREETEGELGEEEVERAMNQWLSGHLLDRHLDQLQTDSTATDNHLAPLLQRIEGSESTSYKTGSRQDSGPDGFQAATDLQDAMRAITGSWSAVHDAISSSIDVAERLAHWAVDDQTIESDREYVQSVIDTYTTVFPHSELDVDQLTSRWWPWALGLVTALGVAGLAAFALGAS